MYIPIEKCTNIQLKSVPVSKDYAAFTELTVFNQIGQKASKTFQIKSTNLII